MSSNVEFQTTTPTTQLRRFFASAIAASYGSILIVVWGSVPLNLLNNADEASSKALWIALALSVLFYFVCLVSIPQSYYDLRPFEMDGRVYRRLGVRKFRFIVNDGDGMQRLVQQIDPLWQSGLTKLSNEERIKRTRGVELLKLAFIWFTLPIIALAYYRGRTILASLFLLSNIPFNVYPILLQRYSRAKLLRIGQLRSKRSTSKSDLVSASTAS